MNNIANLPDMLGWHIGNPLGLGSIAMLFIILVLVETMSVFDYFIRHRDKPQFYPVLYSLFGVSLLAVFYYAFQADLPTIHNDVKCIGWFLYISKVGIVWAILGFVLAIHVCYGLLNAMMQITAQLSVEGNLIEGKPWKEWKIEVFTMIIAALLTTVALFASYTASSWMLIVGEVAIVLFALYKIIADTVRSRKFGWSLLTGIVFLAGIEVCYMLTLECLRGCVFFIVLLAAFLTQAKARKKKAYKEDQPTAAE